MAKKGKGKLRNEKPMNNKMKIFIKTQVLALIIYTILFTIVSIISYNTDIDASKSFYAAIAAFAVSSFICGFYSGYKIHKNGLYIGLLYCLPANIIVTLISLIINALNVDFTILISLVILIICSMLGGIMSVNTKLKAK